jgi:sulfate adenylyltransferase
MTSWSQLPLPHGGSLVNRVIADNARDELVAYARTLPKIPLSNSALSDVELIATGAFSPLTGFLSYDDYHAVVSTMRLANGTVWPLPITLRVQSSVPVSSTVALTNAATDPVNDIIATLQVTDVYQSDKVREAELVYGTDDPAHPGVARLFTEGNILLGGPITLLQRSISPYPELTLDPQDTRRLFSRRNWRTVVGFQTRNPIHRAHEYLQKSALEIVDGLLLHPLVGATKSDDVPADVRIQSYHTLLERYYPRERAVLAVYPAAMRYAGPREAVFHALARKNYGCSHFVVGRDHAGVGAYYGAYDAQRIFDQFTPEEIGITILKFEHAFYCRACGGMASRKTCPHPSEAHITLSGTRVRELLRAGRRPPTEFSRPEVADVLIQGLASTPSIALSSSQPVHV